MRSSPQLLPRHRSAAGRGLRGAPLLVLVVLLACGACTALLDKNATQCESDSDCVHFGGHPYCQGGVCVVSGLGPANCVSGPPQQPSDFLNQCSDSQCLSFDDCSRLGACTEAGDFDAGLLAPPDAGAATPAAPAAEAGASGDGGVTRPSCLDPTNGRAQAIYLTGSSNFPPLLAKLAPLIVDAGYTPVYQVTSSCAGVASILGSSNVISDPAPGSSAQPAEYFQQDGTAVPCTLGPVGATVDVGESDIFSSTCAGYGAPAAGFAEYLGPIQAMVFVVPGASTQQAISAEAARTVFGMGGDDGAAKPWNNPDLYFVRNQNTGTQQMIAKAINVPPAEFWGIDRGSASAVDSELRVISDPSVADQAIGIISADYYDGDRANLAALAFKAEGQDCAYLPDSTPYKKDKQNVRDGHYPIWGPIHFFAAVSGGIPVSPAAEAFVSVVSVPNLAQPLLDAFIAASLVPTCAMMVQRSSELGALSTYTPPFECGCYFQASLGGPAPSTCTKCTTANDCADPTHPACNLGFCETQ